MPNAINEKIGSLVVDGMTRDEIAKELGISRPTLARKLRGKSGWKWAEVVKVSEMTGCTLDELANVDK